MEGVLHLQLLPYVCVGMQLLHHAVSIIHSLLEWGI